MGRKFQTNFRTSQQEHEALLFLSLREGVTQSELCRLLIREALEKRGVPSPGLIRIAPYMHGKEKNR
jgi:hypothetical protein